MEIEAPVQAAALESAEQLDSARDPLKSETFELQALRTYNLHSVRPGFIRANGPAECPGM